MDVYVVRHAIAAQRDDALWPDDSKRPLTERGTARYRQAACGLSKIVPNVDRVLSSPYPRAWQTAEILQAEAGWPAPEPCPELEADRSPGDVVPVLEGVDHDSALALVGHEPLLSQVVSLLLTGDEHLVHFELKKGGVVFVQLADGEIGRGLLRWSVSPKILRALAG